jgi:hypothetical protein
VRFSIARICSSLFTSIHTVKCKRVTSLSTYKISKVVSGKKTKPVSKSRDASKLQESHEKVMLKKGDKILKNKGGKNPKTEYRKKDEWLQCSTKKQNKIISIII